MKTVVKENANGGKGQVVVKYILDDNRTGMFPGLS